VYKIINQNEKFIAVGDFTSYNDVGRNRITRILEEKKNI
jgi:RNA-binding protein YlmH